MVKVSNAEQVSVRSSEASGELLKVLQVNI